MWLFKFIIPVFLGLISLCVSANEEDGWNDFNNQAFSWERTCLNTGKSAEQCNQMIVDRCGQAQGATGHLPTSCQTFIDRTPIGNGMTLGGGSDFERGVIAERSCANFRLEGFATHEACMEKKGQYCPAIGGNCDTASIKGDEGTNEMFNPGGATGGDATGLVDTNDPQKRGQQGQENQEVQQQPARNTLTSAGDTFSSCRGAGQSEPNCQKITANYCSQNRSAEGCSNFNSEVLVDQEVPTPGRQATGSSANVAALAQKVEQCRATTKNTSMCCKDPVKCIAEDAGAEDGSGYGQAAGMLQQIMTMGTMMSASGVADMCGKMKTIGNLNAVLSAGLGRSCSNNINKCEDMCGNVQREVSQALEQCMNDPSCPAYDRTELRGLQSRAESQIAACESNTKYSSAQYSQAAASGVGAYMAGKCEDSAKGTVANQFDANDIDAFNTNCSDPSAASNPICQNNCQRPGAENDPMCRQLLGLDGNNGQAGDGVAQRDPLAGANSDAEAFGLEDDLEGSQDFNGGVTAQTTNKADVNMQKGPGIGGGSGGAGGAGGAGGGGRSPASKGYNTNILKGYSGGGGYSQQMGNRYQAGSGGFSGYGNGQRAKKGGNPFDLSKYLPGKGGKQGALRNVAGLVNVNRELGKPSENIFQKMSNRFYNVCLKNRLYDCGKNSQ